LAVITVTIIFTVIHILAILGTEIILYISEITMEEEVLETVLEIMLPEAVHLVDLITEIHPVPI